MLEHLDHQEIVYAKCPKPAKLDDADAEIMEPGK